MLCSEDQHTYTKFCKVFVDCTVIIGNHDHKLQDVFHQLESKDEAYYMCYFQSKL